MQKTHFRWIHFRHLCQKEGTKKNQTGGPFGWTVSLAHAKTTFHNCCSQWENKSKRLSKEHKFYKIFETATRLNDQHGVIIASEQNTSYNLSVRSVDAGMDGISNKDKDQICTEALYNIIHNKLMNCNGTMLLGNNGAVFQERASTKHDGCWHTGRGGGTILFLCFYLLLRNLKGLHVVAYDLQLLLQLKDLTATSQVQTVLQKRKP